MRRESYLARAYLDHLHLQIFTSYTTSKRQVAPLTQPLLVEKKKKTKAIYPPKIAGISITVTMYKSNDANFLSNSSYR